MNREDHFNASSDIQIKLVKKFRLIARTFLLILSLLLIIFSVLSGAGEDGIVANLPNAIPGGVLLLFTFIAWKWEMFGGFIIVVMGVLSVFFFDVFEKNAWPVLFAVSLPLLILGGLFVVAAGLSNEK